MKKATKQKAGEILGFEGITNRIKTLSKQIKDCSNDDAMVYAARIAELVKAAEFDEKLSSLGKTGNYLELNIFDGLIMGDLDPSIVQLSIDGQPELIIDDASETTSPEENDQRDNWQDTAFNLASKTGELLGFDVTSLKKEDNPVNNVLSFVDELLNPSSASSPLVVGESRLLKRLAEERDNLKTQFDNLAKTIQDKQESVDAHKHAIHQAIAKGTHWEKLATELALKISTTLNWEVGVKSADNCPVTNTLYKLDNLTDESLRKPFPIYADSELLETLTEELNHWKDKATNLAQEKDNEVAQHSKTISERDYWEEQSTNLAEKIGSVLNFEVGEHSSANCPVQNALRELDVFVGSPFFVSVSDHSSQILEQIGRERDQCNQKAIQLANKVAEALGFEFGEQTNSNCPVLNAIAALEAFISKPIEAGDCFASHGESEVLTQLLITWRDQSISLKNIPYLVNLLIEDRESSHRELARISAKAKTLAKQVSILHNIEIDQGLESSFQVNKVIEELNSTLMQLQGSSSDFTISKLTDLLVKYWSGNASREETKVLINKQNEMLRKQNLAFRNLEDKSMDLTDLVLKTSGAVPFFAKTNSGSIKEAISILQSSYDQELQKRLSVNDRSSKPVILTFDVNSLLNARPQG